MELVGTAWVTEERLGRPSGGVLQPGAGFVGVDPTASLVEDVIIVGPGHGLAPATLYLDTSVVGGCYDPEFEAATLPLLDRIRNGDANLVTSEVLFDELKPAPDRVRAVLDSIPKKYTRSHAMHVACATLARVDALLSWHLKHMVHPEKIRRFRKVNRRFDQDYFEINSPREVLYVN